MNLIKNFFSDAKESFFVLFYALKDKRTPLYAKIFIILAVFYLFFPLDAIPDALLPLGLLDDAAIVPAMLYFIYKNIPQELFLRLREKAKRSGKTFNRGLITLLSASAAAVILFLILLYLLYKLIF